MLKPESTEKEKNTPMKHRENMQMQKSHNAKHTHDDRACFLSLFLVDLDI